MEKTKQRISWIDVTKGIAIYLVILGHSLIGLKVNDYIFAFHMPLFFIASGLLFREKSIKKTIAGNIKKLLVPYYITSVCVILGRAVSAYLQGWTVQNIRNLCLNTMIGAVFGYGVDGSKWFFTVWMIGAIWFLWAFFWSDIIIHVVFRYTKNWQEWQRAFNHRNLGSFLYCRTVYLDSYEFRCGWICNFICLYRLSASKNPDMGAGKASVDLLDSLCNCMGLCFPYGRD